MPIYDICSCLLVFWELCFLLKDRTIFFFFFFSFCISNSYFGTFCLIADGISRRCMVENAGLVWTLFQTTLCIYLLKIWMWSFLINVRMMVFLFYGFPVWLRSRLWYFLLLILGNSFGKNDLDVDLLILTQQLLLFPLFWLFLFFVFGNAFWENDLN